MLLSIPAIQTEKIWKIRNKITGKTKEYMAFGVIEGMFLIQLEHPGWIVFKRFPKMLYELVEG